MEPTVSFTGNAFSLQSSLSCPFHLVNSMEFSRQEHWSVLPFPSPGDLSDLGIEPRSPALRADALPSEPPGKPFHLVNSDQSFSFLSIFPCKYFPSCYFIFLIHCNHNCLTDCERILLPGVSFLTLFQLSGS